MKLWWLGIWLGARIDIFLRYAILGKRHKMHIFYEKIWKHQKLLLPDIMNEFNVVELHT